MLSTQTKRDAHSVAEDLQIAGSDLKVATSSLLDDMKDESFGAFRAMRDQLGDAREAVIETLKGFGRGFETEFQKLPMSEQERMARAAENGNAEPIRAWIAPYIPGDQKDRNIPLDIHGVAKVALKGVSFFSMAYFVLSLMDPKRSLLSKGLRLGAFVAQGVFGKRLPSGAVESTPADALVFGNAILGAAASRTANKEAALKNMWRHNVRETFATEFPEAHGLREFLKDYVSSTPLTVRPEYKDQIKQLNDLVSQGVPLSPEQIQLTMDAFHELGFRSQSIIAPDNTLRVCRTLRFGLRKGYVSYGEKSKSIIISGKNTYRTLPIPATTKVRGTDFQPITLLEIIEDLAQSVAYEAGSFAETDIIIDHEVALGNVTSWMMHPIATA
jgi:hypothetical protein